jgi:glutamate-1-semialdehyde 2,1-aminomutase
LIFDEVITGFRVGLGGAQALLGVTPDLAVFAKALGAGFPISALAGRGDIMDGCVDGGVLHGGSYNSNVVSVAAALAALRVLAADGARAYADMQHQGERLMAGIAAAARARGRNLKVQGLGSVFNTAFTEQPAVADYRAYLRCDAEALARFVRGLQAEGVYITRRGTWFLSTAHQPADIDATVDAVERVLAGGGLP